MFGEFIYWTVLHVIHDMQYEHRQQLTADDDGMPVAPGHG